MEDLDLFDTHCHLNLAQEFPDPDAEIARANAAGVRRLCLVGIDLESCRRALEIAERNDGIYAIVGWHPNSAATYSPSSLEAIADMLEHPKAVAMGEIGLDYHWDYASPDQQKRCLVDQLDLAERMDKPVIFHCRKAYEDLLSLLEERAPRPYLFHCFSGNSAQAERVRAMDGLIGVDGPVTYKKADDLRALVRAWPRDRLVLETDSPYLSPEPFRGKPNHPAYLPYVNAAVASCWNLGATECADRTTTNARAFFGV